MIKKELSNDKDFVVIFGKPGSGKGTISSMFCKEEKEMHNLNIISFSTGEYLRKLKQDPKMYKLYKQEFDKMDQGKRVSNKLVIAAVKKAIMDAEDGIIFDGFPRNEYQAKWLYEYLKSIGQNLNSVIILDVPDNEVLRRLSSRKTCPVCGKVYNSDYKSNYCKCGHTLIVRDDDTEFVIKNRLNDYKKYSKEVLSYFKSLSDNIKFYNINANRPKEKVLKDFIRVF